MVVAAVAVAGLAGPRGAKASLTDRSQAVAPAADLRTAILRADDARLHSAADRAVIDAALASDVAATQVMAIRAVGRTRRAEFLDRAAAALDNGSIDVRREAAFAVAHIGSATRPAHAAALDALRTRLARETDPFVTASLAESVGRLAFPATTDVDAAARDVAAAWARAGTGPALAVVSAGVARGAEAMARRVRTLSGSDGGSPALVTLLEALLDRHAPPPQGIVAPQDVLDRRVRRLATSGLIALRALSLARRTAAAADVDDQVRRLAVLDLAARADVSEAAATPAFDDSSMLVRHAAMSRLGTRFVRRATAALDDRHPTVRLAALDALGEARACGRECEARAAVAPTDEHWHEGAHALVALARTDAAAARPLVSRAAASDVWHARMYAARAAGITGQADVLHTLASDNHVNVRHAALSAWREAKLPNLTAAAIPALGSDDGQLVIEAAAAVAGARVPGVVPALRSALSRLTAMRRDTSRDPRMALVERLDELDAERDVSLRPYLSDFDPAIAARVTALLRARGLLTDGAGLRSQGSGSVPTAGSGLGARGSESIQRAGVPTWEEVEQLGGTTVALRLRGGRVLTMRLYAEIAPTAIARFVTQVKAGEWNGRTFHRVEPGFVVQGGSPSANEYAGAAAFTRDEISSLSHVRGTIGISTRGPDTGDGQIFINLVDNPRLDFAYTVIGSIVGDTAPLDDIVEGDVIDMATAQQAQAR